MRSRHLILCCIAAAALMLAPAPAHAQRTSTCWRHYTAHGGGWYDCSRGSSDASRVAREVASEARVRAREAASVARANARELAARARVWRREDSRAERLMLQRIRQDERRYTRQRINYRFRW